MPFTDITGEDVGFNNSATAKCGWNFVVLMSRQGKIRLSEFFSPYTETEKKRILRDIAADILPRAPKMCNIIEKGTYRFVYRRYASLYFVVGVPQGLNELIVLEQIHLFVEALDGYFNSGKFCVAVTMHSWRKTITMYVWYVAHMPSMPITQQLVVSPYFKILHCSSYFSLRA